jgi:hypothetical protein
LRKAAKSAAYRRLGSSSVGLKQTRPVAPTRSISFPFRPKSTAYLSPGMFWGVPLRDGRTACGRVLQIEPGGRVTFLAGLMDWVGSEAPTSEAIAGARLLTQGTAHLKTITENGGEILGMRPLELDGIEPLPQLSHAMPPGVRLVQGFTDVRAATGQEVDSLDVIAAWGFNVITVFAEQFFVDGEVEPWWLHVNRRT